MEKSFAMELLEDSKRNTKRWFIVWVITFIVCIGLVAYVIYLLNDINTITAEQQIEDIDTITGSDVMVEVGK